MTDPPDARHGLGALNTDRALVKTTRGGRARPDSAPVTRLVSTLLDAVPGPHVLRDPARGGLATALCEIALASQVGIRIEDADVPLQPEVRGACELLGSDPLYVACEGRFVAILREEDVERALVALHRVVLHTRVDSDRLLERLSGEQLPRIC